MNDNLIIQNHTLLDHFKQHLDLPENNDIIFSAPFGTGKTYFLRDDFTEKMKERYNVIHLYPVNYSVASNEDIFELIKYDLLFDLMLKFGEQIENLDDLQIDKGLAIQLYIQNNFKAFDFIQQVFKSTSKLGKNISDVIDILKLEKSKYERFVEELKSNEYDTIKNYFESFKSKKGLLEFDTISVLIKEILAKIKGEKENVLIIDDLDRIDPEHIFRIFNVLSAHRDQVTQKNKFGFDKVILVCDIENIKRIYEHRYGRNVDFQGYINKFYSRAVYEFDNRRYIKGQLSDYLKKLRYPSFSDLGRDYEKFNLSTNFGDGFYHVVHTCVLVFVTTGHLSLRSLKNLTELTFANKILTDPKYGGFHVNSSRYELFVLVGYLSNFFGTYERLKEATRAIVKELKDGNLMTLGVETSNFNIILRNLLQMTIDLEIMHDECEEGQYEYTIEGSSLTVLYKVNRNGIESHVFIDPSAIDKSLYKLNFLQVLDHSLNIIEHRQLLS